MVLLSYVEQKTLEQILEKIAMRISYLLKFIYLSIYTLDRYFFCFCLLSYFPDEVLFYLIF